MEDDILSNAGFERIVNPSDIESRKHNILDGEFAVVTGDNNSTTDFLYYTPDGRGGIKFVYADPPSEHSYTI